MRSGRLARAVALAALTALTLTGCSPAWDEQAVRSQVMSIDGVLNAELGVIRDDGVTASGLTIDVAVTANMSGKQIGWIADRAVFTAWDASEVKPLKIVVRVHEAPAGGAVGVSMSDMKKLDLRDPMRDADWPETLVPYLDTISLSQANIDELIKAKQAPTNTPAP